MVFPMRIKQISLPSAKWDSLFGGCAVSDGAEYAAAIGLELAIIPAARNPAVTALIWHIWVSATHDPYQLIRQSTRAQAQAGRLGEN